MKLRNIKGQQELGFINTNFSPQYGDAIPLEDTLIYLQDNLEEHFSMLTYNTVYIDLKR